MQTQTFTCWAESRNWLLVLENPNGVIGTHVWDTWVTPSGTVVYVHSQEGNVLGVVQGVMQDD